MDRINFSTKFSRQTVTDKYDKYRNLKHYNSKSIDLLEYRDTLETIINVPLLKNSNGGVNKLYYDNTKINHTIEKLKLLEDKEDIIADKLTSFIELAVNIDTVKITKNYLQSIKALLKNIIKKGSVKNDTNLVKNKIIKVKRIFAKNLIELKNSKKELSNEINNINIENIDFNYKIRNIFVKIPLDYIKIYNRDLKILRLDIIKKESYIKHYKNQQLIDLDFNIWAVNTKNKGNYSYYSYYDKNEIGVSLEMTYSLSGSSANNFNLLEAKLRLKKQQINYNKQVKDKIEDIAKLANKLSLYEDNLESFLIEIKNTNKEVELSKYLNNKGDIKFVLDELSEFYDLRLDYLSEEFKYHSTRVNYNNKLDRLINKKIKCDFCLKNNY